jgi:hypothetical protein
MTQKGRKAKALVPASRPPAATDRLLGNLRGMIEAARAQTARAVNAGLVALCWSVGERIRRDILQ